MAGVPHTTEFSLLYQQARKGRIRVLVAFLPQIKDAVVATLFVII